MDIIAIVITLFSVAFCYSLIPTFMLWVIWTKIGIGFLFSFLPIALQQPTFWQIYGIMICVFLICDIRQIKIND